MDTTIGLSGRVSRLEVAGTDLCIVFVGGDAELHDLSSAARPPHRLSSVSAAAFLMPTMADDGSFLDESPPAQRLCATLGNEPSRPLLRLHDPVVGAEVAQLRAPATVGMAPFQLATCSPVLSIVGAVFGTAAVFEVRVDASGATAVTLIATVGGGRARSGGCTSALLTSSHALLGHKDGGVLACFLGHKDGGGATDPAATIGGVSGPTPDEASQAHALAPPTPPEVTPPATPPPSPPSPSPPSTAPGAEMATDSDAPSRPSSAAGASFARDLMEGIDDDDGDTDELEAADEADEADEEADEEEEAANEGEEDEGEEPGENSADAEAGWLQPARVLVGHRCVPFAPPTSAEAAEPDASAIVGLHLLRWRRAPSRRPSAAHDGAPLLSSDVLAVDAAGRLAILTLSGRSAAARATVLQLATPLIATTVFVLPLRASGQDTAAAGSVLMLDTHSHTLARLPLAPAYAVLDADAEGSAAAGTYGSAGGGIVANGAAGGSGGGSCNGCGVCIARGDIAGGAMGSAAGMMSSSTASASALAACPVLKPDLSVLLRSGASVAAWVDGGSSTDGQISDCLLLGDGNELHAVHLKAPPLPLPLPATRPPNVATAAHATATAAIITTSAPATTPSSSASCGGGGGAAHTPSLVARSPVQPRWAPSPAAAAAAAAAAAGGPRLGLAAATHTSGARGGAPSRKG